MTTTIEGTAPPLLTRAQVAEARDRAVKMGDTSLVMVKYESVLHIIRTLEAAWTDLDATTAAIASLTAELAGVREEYEALREACAGSDVEALRQLAERTRNKSHLRTRAEVAEEDLTTARARTLEIEAALRQAEKAWGQALADLDTARARIAELEEALRAADQRFANLHDAKRDAETDRAVAEATITQQAERIAALEADASAMVDALAPTFHTEDDQPHSTWYHAFRREIVGAIIAARARLKTKSGEGER